MAELSDDTLSDDDPLKRNEELEEGHPFRGLVFHWASDIGGWGNKALGDDDQAWADEYKLSIREGAPEYLQDRVRLVPRVFEGPPPPTADAAFRAALVGDVFGYYGIHRRPCWSRCFGGRSLLTCVRGFGDQGIWLWRR